MPALPTAAAESTKAALAKAVAEAAATKALTKTATLTPTTEPISPTTALETAEPVLACAARLLLAVRPRCVPPAACQPLNVCCCHPLPVFLYTLPLASA